MLGSLLLVVRISKIWSRALLIITRTQQTIALRKLWCFFVWIGVKGKREANRSFAALPKHCEQSIASWLIENDKKNYI